MTADKSVEAAVYSALKTAFTGQTVNIVPFVATRNVGDDSNVNLPAVQFVCEPFVTEQQEARLGHVKLTLVVRTQTQDDSTRASLESLFETAKDAIAAGTLGPLVYSPWLLCGVDGAQDGTVSVDEDGKFQDKAKTYRIAMFDTQQTTTTTTTTSTTTTTTTT